jgi:hypothetical protein
MRSSLSNEQEVLVLSEAAVLLSPFKVLPAKVTAEVALPSPIPFVNYQELEPAVAVSLLLVKAAAILALKNKHHSPIPFVNYQVLKNKHHSPIPFVNYQELEQAAVISHLHYRKDQRIIRVQHNA